MRFNNSLGNRKAEPRTSPHFFRCEEGLKDAVTGFRRNPRSAVFYVDSCQSTVASTPTVIFLIGTCATAS